MAESLAYQHATSQGGIGLEAMNQNIRDFLAKDPTPEQTRAAMAEYGVSEADIQRATGQTFDQIFDPAPATTGAYVRSPEGLEYWDPNAAAATTAAPASQQASQQGLGSLAYQHALSQGGIGLEAMNKNITDFFANKPTISQTLDAMKQWGVSEEDIKRATGKDLQQLLMPADWNKMGAKDRINYLNKQGVTPDQLRTYGVTDADLAWMASQGYTGLPGGTDKGYKGEALDPSQSTLSPNFADYVYRMLAKGEEIADKPYEEYKGKRFADTSPLYQQAFSGIASLADPAAFAEAQKMLSGVGKGIEGLSYTPGQFTTGLTTPRARPLPTSLPQFPKGWEDYTPEQKIAWFNENKVDVDTMRRFGVAPADIGYMLQKGYKGTYGPSFATPEGWEGFTAQEKINWLNQNRVQPEELRGIGLSTADLDWMKGQGYGALPVPVSPTVAPTTAPSPAGITLPGTPPGTFGATPGWSGPASAMAARIGVNPLPQGWAGYTPEQKINYYNTEKIGTNQLLQAGVPQSEIDWMLQNNYKGTYADGGLTTTGFNAGLGSFQLPSVADYMSPYTSAVTDIEAREARRQADIGRTAEQARLAQAGAYGGSRQAIMEAERQRNLQTQIGDITNRGLQSAYDRAMTQRQQEAQLGLETQKMGEQSRQFGAELGLKGLGLQTQAAQAMGQLGVQQGQFGLDALKTMMGAGQVQQQLAQQPYDFGYQQWQESMKYPYQQATFMSSLLGGLPLSAQKYDTGTSGLAGLLQALGLAMGGYKAFEKATT